MKLKEKIWIVILSFIIIIGGITYFFFRNEINSFVDDNILHKEKEITINNNIYSKSESYNYVQLTNDFYARDYNHLLNIIYTIVNSGNNSFTFYCSKDYEDCINNFDTIANNQDIISNINNFVHPFNSFDKFLSSYSEDGEITLTLDKVYTDVEINQINSEVDKIIKNNLDDTMTNTKKIEVIHDYLINNAKYVKDDNNYCKSNNLLFDKKGICSAYTDTMAIILSKLNFNNYKIAANNHIWNLVYMDNKWLHVDVTFDDPVTNTGEDILLKDMFLIDTQKLLELDNESHNFDRTTYSEAN